MSTSVRCLHGLDSRFCAICNRKRREATAPARQAQSSRRPRRVGDAPSTKQWRRYCELLEAKRLELMRTTGQVHICILCGLTMSWLDAVEPAVKWSGLTGGTRTDPGDRRVISKLAPATIRIGARIKVWEHVDVGEAEPELRAKIVPMTLTGLGCSACRDLMFREETAALGDYQDENAQFSRHMATTGMRRALIRRGITPQRRVPYIDITDRVAQVEAPGPTGTPQPLDREPHAAFKPGLSGLERWRAMRKQQEAR